VTPRAFGVALALLLAACERPAVVLVVDWQEADAPPVGYMACYKRLLDCRCDGKSLFPEGVRTSHIAVFADDPLFWIILHAPSGSKTESVQVDRSVKGAPEEIHLKLNLSGLIDFPTTYPGVTNPQCPQ